MKPEIIVGRSTVESIQSGLYYSHLATTQEITKRISEECFANEPPIIIGTGGFASLFENDQAFDVMVPDLVLNGLFLSLKLNT